MKTAKEPYHSFGVAKLTFVFTLINHVHGCGQIPHLDAAICMPSEEVAARPRAHSAGSFAFSYSKGWDGSAINCLDLTDSTQRETPSSQNTCTWQSLANKRCTILIFREGNKNVIRERPFFRTRVLPLHDWHAAHLQVMPSPCPCPSHPPSAALPLIIFIRGTPCVQCASSVHSDQKLKALKMGEHSRMGQVALSYARYSRILTCRNSIFNHIKHEKNPRMINPRLSTQIIFVSWQLQYDNTPELHRFFFPYFRRWCGERQKRDSQN